MDDASEVSEVEPSIFGGSEPSNGAPQVVAAGEHANGVHPFFSRVGGRGRGGGRAAATAPDALTMPGLATADDAEAGPRFCGISIRELEYLQRQSADGADSSIVSDDENTPKRRTKRAKASSEQQTKRPKGGGEVDALAAAAFGGVDEDDDEDDEVCEEVDEGASDASKDLLLPIRGEQCLGCTLDRTIVEQVDTFVRKNAMSLSESALYRSAALFFHNEIVLPRRREGVRVPAWRWKSLRSHYVLHVCDAVLQRAAAVRSLGAVRAVQENALMKINQDGTKTLDHKGAELLLKVLAVSAFPTCDRRTRRWPTRCVRAFVVVVEQMQDKQLAAIDTARMPPPARGGR